MHAVSEQSKVLLKNKIKLTRANAPFTPTDLQSESFIFQTNMDLFNMHMFYYWVVLLFTIMFGSFVTHMYTTPIQ